MKETGKRSSLFGVLLAFAAAPAFAQPAGPPSGKPEAKAEKAAEKAEAKAAKADDKSLVKAAKADEKAQKAETKEEKGEARGKAEGRGPGDHAQHGMPGAGPSGHPRGARAPHGHRGFRGLGHEFSRGNMTKPELEKRIAEMRANKAERRKEHREGLRQRWGVALAHPACREELRHHARREAFLSRALFLAQTQVAPKDRDKLIERIEKLIDKEEERHTRAMERLKSMPPPPASAAAVASAAPGAPAAPPAAASSGKAGDQ